VRARLLAAAVTIGLASVVWTTAAAADNPHGTPPGQQKASASATVNASAQTNASAHADVKAHVKGTVVVKTTAQAKTKASGHAHGAVNAQAQPTVSAGVAPSSATSKNTLEAATSSKTKLYGNGKTAGQIAVQSGFGNSMLYGPGNSQPHKTACGAHMIDVHALKAHGTAACASPSVSTSETSSVSPAQANVAASAAAQAAAGNSQAAAGNSGVRSAKTSAPKKANKHASGVLSAKAALASTAKKPLRLVATVRHGNLPFTGFALWMPMALGLGLIATGLAMRRRGTSLT
jgi:hypothetical protein